jgi:dienelactone hydrolase
MGETIHLTAEDGVTISAYIAKPAGTPRGGVVVLQEIFGVNHHIRAVADRYAAEGYLAVAPALYDRVQPGYESGYEQPDMQAGVATRAKTDPAKVLLDVKAAVVEASKAGKVGVVGYCWGGTLALLRPPAIMAQASRPCAIRHPRRRPCCISAKLITPSRWLMWRRSKLRVLMCRSLSMALAMASTAMNAVPITKTALILHASAPMNFSPSMLADE